MHNKHISLLLALAPFAGDVLANASPAPSPKPNIIFILTDDQGYGDLSCHGNPVLKTPNMDRLHDEGVRFSRFYVSPTCSPTRSALMTGRHPFKNGVTHTIYERERLTLGAKTIADVLKTAGYTTGVFGKWHLGDEDEYQPDKRGFDEVFIHGGGGIGQTYEGSCGDVPGNTYFDPVIKHNGRFVKTDGYCTDVFFTQAMKWMGSVKGKKPFFAYLATNAPHTPLQVRPEDEALYAGQVDDRIAKFFGMIANIDDNIGRLLAQLEAWGIEDNTLIVFMTDNGATEAVRFYNAGMRGRKGMTLHGGTRAASFWRWPGTLQPGTVDKLCAHYDVYPTLAELAGATMPEDHARDGISLVPLLKGTSSTWPDRTIVAQVGRWPKGSPPVKERAASVKWRDWNLVYRKGAWKLYNLADDPGERNNVVNVRPEIVASLQKRYDAWWQEVTPYLVNEDAYKTAPAINPFKEGYARQLTHENQGEDL
jgi:arylsulfatase A-like enzyme